MKNEISNIINAIKGKNIVSRRIEALEAAGYSVIYSGCFWNFGTSGTVKETENGAVLAQLSCAKATKARNGYRLNACDVYIVKANN